MNGARDQETSERGDQKHDNRQREFRPAWIERVLDGTKQPRDWVGAEFLALAERGPVGCNPRRCAAGRIGAAAATRLGGGGVQRSHDASSTNHRHNWP